MDLNEGAVVLGDEETIERLQAYVTPVNDDGGYAVLMFPGDRQRIPIYESTELMYKHMTTEMGIRGYHVKVVGDIFDLLGFAHGAGVGVAANPRTEDERTLWSEVRLAGEG
jgi:hypothetical protein